ncbi:MAG: hypothetical protein RMJ33_11100 [Saprospiraceae bacterium]|nr:T9SS type A sorting domain-containing protein [Saprospiraceae bacterium]MDW8230374.1 hypothetical protein [Saprospiraceae bacterium]
MLRNVLLMLCALGWQGALWAQQASPCPGPVIGGAAECSQACLVCSLNGLAGQTGVPTSGTAPGFCGELNNGRWYGFVARVPSMTLRVKPSKCAKGNGLEVALYESCQQGPLACVVGEAGSGDVERILTLSSLTPGRTYRLLVDGYATDQCHFTITTTPPDAVATPVPGTISSITGPTVVLPGSTIYYSITPVPGATGYRWSGTGDVRINGQLSSVVLPADQGARVAVTFANQSSRLCVTPINACAEGNPTCIDVRVVPADNSLTPPCPSGLFPAPDLCGDACIYCDLTTYTGSSAGYTASIDAGLFCGTIENDQWLGFIAGDTAIQITLQPSNCQRGDGMQMALYPAVCNAQMLPLACEGGGKGKGDTPISISASITPGKPYYLRVDGYAGDVCNFTLSVSPPGAATAKPMSETGVLQGPALVCPGSMLNYFVPPVTNASAYVWSAPPGWRIQGQTKEVVQLDAPGGNFVQVIVGNTPGLFQICVQPINSCEAGILSCRMLRAEPIPPTVLPPVTVCHESTPYTLPWGQQVTSSGVYQHVYKSSLGCDSIVRQQVIVKAPIIRNLGLVTLCAGECFTVCGKSFCGEGTYSTTCQSYQGCDSIINFSIIVVEPRAEIFPKADPLCATFPLTLRASPSAGSFTWTNAAGVVLGTGTLLTVNAPGTYILTVRAQAGGQTCIDRDTAVVVEGVPPATPLALGGVITCAQPQVQLVGHSAQPGLLTEWFGPGGFYSTNPTPLTDVPGTYTFVVTDPSTGCKASATAPVTVDTLAPSVSLPAQAEINCKTPSLTLLCPAPVGAQCRWEKDGVPLPGPNPLATAGGAYVLTVTYANGCTTTASTTITEDFRIPQITLPPVVINCYNPTAQIACEVDIPLSTCECDLIIAGLCRRVLATAPNGCKSVKEVVYHIDVDPPTIAVRDDTLTCAKPALKLTMGTSATHFAAKWTGPAGFTSTEPNPVVTVPGVYEVTVINLDNGCSASASLMIRAALDFILPPVPPPGPLTCKDTVVRLRVVPDPTGLLFSWTGPNNFVSTEPAPLVSIPGVYRVIVVQSTTGCSATAILVLSIDTFAVQLTQQTDTLTCLRPAATVNLPQVPGWTPRTITAGGVYRYDVVNPQNGCISKVTLVAPEDKAQPQITVVSIVPDTLGRSVGSITIQVTHPGAYEVKWFRLGQQVGQGLSLSGIPGGNYEVVVTGSNGCTNTLSIFLPDTGVSTREPGEASLWRLYPNPTGDWAQLRYLGASAPEGRLLLINATGRLAAEERLSDAGQTTFSCAHLPSGTYTALVLTSQGAVRLRLMVQR